LSWFAILRSRLADARRLPFNFKIEEEIDLKKGVYVLCIYHRSETTNQWCYGFTERSPAERLASAFESSLPELHLKRHESFWLMPFDMNFQTWQLHSNSTNVSHEQTLNF
jgi:hypothetical protein